MMKLTKFGLVALVAAMIGSFAVIGCQQAAQAGDDVADKTGDMLEETGEVVDDAVDGAGEAVEGAVDDAGDAVEDAVDGMTEDDHSEDDHSEEEGH